MSYSKYYNPTNWENYPSEDTAINAMHLNNLEDGVDTLDDRIVALSTDKSEVSWNQTLISGEKIAEITVNGITKDVYAPEISDSVVEQAAEQALKSEGYAVGTQGDIPVTSGLYYHNNSKYYSEQASDSASDASASAVEAGQSADDAEEEALVSEGWAVGEQNGDPVEQGSPYYHNNAKWYSEQTNPTALANLTDTDIDNPQTNQPLSYDGEKWINDSGLMLVSSGEKTLWNGVGDLYKYTLLDQVAQINSNVSGSVPPIAVKDYSKGELFIQQKKLLKAITNISLGDDLIKNTNYIEITVADELALKADIRNYEKSGYFPFNAWDGKWDIGQYNQTTGVKESGTAKISVNYIKAKPNTTYYLKSGNTFRFFQYDSNKTYISNGTVNQNNEFTTSANTYYMTFQTANSADLSSVCINISDSELNGLFLPYAPSNAELFNNKTDISVIGTDESGRTTASRSYTRGERFYKDGKYCRTKTAVAQGATWTLNTNYEETSIASEQRVQEESATVPSAMSSYVTINRQTIVRCGLIVSVAMQITVNDMPSNGGVILNMPFTNQGTAKFFSIYGGSSFSPTGTGVYISSDSYEVRCASAIPNGQHWISGTYIMKTY